MYAGYEAQIYVSKELIYEIECVLKFWIWFCNKIVLFKKKRVHCVMVLKQARANHLPLDPTNNRLFRINDERHILPHILILILIKQLLLLLSIKMYCEPTDPAAF